MDLAFDLKTPTLTAKEQLLHEQALAKAKKFKSAHAELLQIVIEVDKAKLYEKFLLTSTYSYCLKILNLSESITCTLTKVARASHQFPELKEAIISDEIHMSNARQIAHLLSQENKTEWIEKAKCLTQDGLQKEIVKQFPKEAVKEKAKYVADKRIKLEVGLDEEVMGLLRWAQDFVCQKNRTSANIEETLKEILTEFKDRHDPVLKAQRSESRKSKQTEKFGSQGRVIGSQNANTVSNPNRIANEAQKIHKGRAVTNVLPVARHGAEQNVNASASDVVAEEDANKETKNKANHNKRTPIPAAIIHQVNLRDQRQCQAKFSNGNICGSSRWIHYHHKTEVQHGGTHSLKNLITLCSQHHHLHHR